MERSCAWATPGPNSSSPSLLSHASPPLPLPWGPELPLFLPPFILSLHHFLQNPPPSVSKFSWPIQHHMAFVSCSSPCTTTNPISFSSTPPPPLCPFVCPFLSVSFPTRKKGCSRIKACASISPSNGPSAAGGPDGKLPNGNLVFLFLFGCCWLFFDKVRCLVVSVDVWGIVFFFIFGGLGV